MKKILKCNSFDAAPGGAAGSINIQPSLGTHASPSNYQDPSKFTSSDYNKYYDKDRTSQPDTRVTDTSGSFNPDVDKLFKGKVKPTVDSVLCGIQYELSVMIHKDKRIAKERVIDNMKKYGPNYYSGLHMLDITDSDLTKNIDESMNNKSPVMQKRINILNQMVAEKQAKRDDLKLNDEIQNILKDKRDQKFARADELLKRFK